MNKTNLLSLIQMKFTYINGIMYWSDDFSPRARRGFPAGSYDANGYLCVKLSGKSYKMHRLIFLLHHGFLPEIVDHINGCKSDNRIENLREASTSLNNANKFKAQTNNKLGILGVVRHKKTGKFQATFAKKYLGLFNSADEASNAVESAREKFIKDLCNNS